MNIQNKSLQQLQSLQKHELIQLLYDMSADNDIKLNELYNKNRLMFDDLIEHKHRLKNLKIKLNQAEILHKNNAYDFIISLSDNTENRMTVSTAVNITNGRKECLKKRIINKIIQNYVEKYKR